MPNQWAAGSCYIDVSPMLDRLAQNFVVKCGGDVDDARSELDEVFLKAYTTYRPGRASFTSWLATNAWSVLGRRFVAERRRNQSLPRVGAEPDQFASPTPAYFDMDEFVAPLSDDARFVVGLVFRGPDIVFNPDSHRDPAIQARNMLKSHLHDLGWDHARVNQSFTEIQGALR